MSDVQIKLDDPDATRRHASDAKSLSEELKGKINAGLARIATLESNKPWGNDKAGAAFAGSGDEGYVAASTGYQENAPDAAPAAAQLFGAVVKAVDTYTGVDDENKGKIDGAVAT